MNFLLNMMLNISTLLDSRLEKVSAEVNSILGTWIGPIFITLGGVGAIYVIVLGVQYIKSESDSKRAEAKTRIINCIIGVVAILILGALCIGVPWDKVVQIFSYTSEEAALKYFIR